jgi:hypothetical protein
VAKRVISSFDVCFMSIKMVVEAAKPNGYRPDCNPVASEITRRSPAVYLRSLARYP